MTRQMKLRHALVSGLALILAAAGCSGSSTATDQEAGTDSPTETAADNGNEADTTAPPETAPPEVEDLPGLPMVDGVDIEQLTARSGGGARPMLEWAAVADADSYTLVVYDADGAPWWSWSGTDTSVVIGGVETDTEIGGPQATSGARWVVMSFDTEGNMTGTSPKRAIEP